MMHMTRTRAFGWAHRIRSVVGHQRKLVEQARAMPRPHVDTRKEVENDLAILDTIMDEIAELAGDAPTPKAWSDVIDGVTDRERAMLMGLLFYDVVADLDRLEQLAKEIEATAKNLATTGEYALPVDPNAETQPGRPKPLPDED